MNGAIAQEYGLIENETMMDYFKQEETARVYSQLSNLEKIDLAIAAEQEKIYFLKSSPLPGMQLMLIIDTVGYLMRLRTEESRKV